jgi:hypothetical protein
MESIQTKIKRLKKELKHYEKVEALDVFTREDMIQFAEELRDLIPPKNKKLTTEKILQKFIVDKFTQEQIEKKKESLYKPQSKQSCNFITFPTFKAHLNKHWNQQYTYNWMINMLEENNKHLYIRKNIE